MNKPPYIVTPNSISVVWEGKPYIVNSDSHNFAGLKKVLIEGRYDEIPNFLNLQKTVEDFCKGNIRVVNEEVYYRGYKLHGVVVDKLLQFLKEGMTDAEPILNFIEKLMSNPSKNSVEQLYTFLSYKVLPLTSEGNVIGYKGVNNNYWSKNGNKNTVVLKGRVDECGCIYNGVGEEIEVARNSVDDNKDRHCSHGLHIGSYDYAKNWAGHDGRLLMVEFNPADAVSVPTDCSFQKLRVCKYKVIGEVPIERKNESEAPLSKPYYDSAEPISIEDEDSIEDDSQKNILDLYNASTILAIKNYIENKKKEPYRTKGPSMKQIQSRLKGIHITCEEIMNICTELGFTVEFKLSEGVSNAYVR
jgi:hypothetical protein